MPPEVHPSRKLLESRRAELLTELRRKAPDTLNEYLQVQAALEAMDLHSRPELRDYSTYRNAIDAVEDYLRRAGEPRSMREVAEAVAEGGYSNGVGRPYWDVLARIRYHWEDRTNKKGEVIPARLTRNMETIGLPEWTEEKFTS